MEELFLNRSDAQEPMPAVENAEPLAASFSPKKPEDWSYEETVTTIETIISQIETGELPIADVFNQFETAVNHLQQCESFLEHHEQKVNVLIETLNDGGNGR